MSGCDEHVWQGPDCPTCRELADLRSQATELASRLGEALELLRYFLPKDGDIRIRRCTSDEYDAAVTLLESSSVVEIGVSGTKTRE